MSAHAFDLDLRGRWRSRIACTEGAWDLLPDLWPAHASRALLVADRQVWRLHGARARAALAKRPVTRVLLTGGEAAKSGARAFRLIERLVAPPFERGDLVIALGGGTISDLVGFAAAVARRGMPLVLLPTTLLAALDAAIGGKTGVDAGGGKNLMGAFHWPRAVLVDPTCLRSLSPAALRAGWAEAVKHALIAGDPLFMALEAHMAARGPGTPPEAELLRDLIRVKTQVVERDPFERGERRTLNAGHTVAHALEAAAGFALSHGEAVALGLRVEGRVAARLTGFPAADLARLEALLDALGLARTPPLPAREVLPLLRLDKKTRAGQVRMALPRRLGQMEPAGGAWALPVEPALVEACWES